MLPDSSILEIARRKKLNKSTKKRLFSYLNSAMLIGGCVFALLYLINFWNKSGAVFPEAHLGYLFAAVVLSLCYTMIYGVGWHLVTLTSGFALSPIMSASIWGMSLLGKYVPTGLVGVTYRTAAYMLYAETKPQHVVLGISIETGASILGGLVVTTLAMMWVGFETTGLQFSVQHLFLAIGVIAGAAMIGLSRPVRTRVFKLIRLDEAIEQVDYRAIALLVLYYSMAWLVIGASFWMFCRSFGITEPSFVHCVVIYAIAGLSGIISIFAPSGIGVREGVMVAMLAAYAPVELALAVALSARLVSLFGEASAITLGSIVLKRKNSENSQKEALNEQK